MVSSNLVSFLIVINIMHSVKSFMVFSPRQKMNEWKNRSVAFALAPSPLDSILDDAMDERYLLCRRDLLNLPLVVVGVKLFESCFPELQPKVANAAYGDVTNIELPSYIDFLIEKNKKIDPSTFLYKGADRDVQLERIKIAISYLESLPAVVRSRKWSQVQGIISGPLGTLTSTMRQICGTSKEAQQVAAKVKADLFEIGRCTMSKDEVACLAAAEAALNDLIDFVKIAF